MHLECKWFWKSTHCTSHYKCDTIGYHPSLYNVISKLSTHIITCKSVKGVILVIFQMGGWRDDVVYIYIYKTLFSRKLSKLHPQDLCQCHKNVHPPEEVAHLRRIAK